MAAMCSFTFVSPPAYPFERILSKHTEEFVTPCRRRSLISSSNPVSTVVSAFMPHLPCSALNPFFRRVLALLRVSPVRLWKSARFTVFGSNPSDEGSKPMASSALSIICCKPPPLSFTFIFLLTLAYWQIPV